MTDEFTREALSVQLQAHVTGVRAKRAEEVNIAAAELVDSLRDATAAASLDAGEMAPGFTLPDALGREVDLAGLLSRGAVILVFYRGGWCPYCNLQLRAYEHVLDEIRALGAELVAVSPQLPDESLSTVERNQLSFPVLSDLGNRVARQYSLVFRVPPRIVQYYLTKSDIVDLSRINGDDSWELPVPGTFVIEPAGRVIFSEVHADYTRRVEPEQLLHVLRDLRA